MSNGDTGFLLDQDDDMPPEGPTLELYWHHKTEAVKGVPGAKEDMQELRKIVEQEIHSNYALALKALDFPSKESLVEWMRSDPNANRMGYADATYREMLQRSRGYGGAE